jgi:DMSO/TMAO reductase YedYZ heme-binding membrane subunit
LTGSTVFWYASWATGIVALLLLTAVLVLGLVVTRQGMLAMIATSLIRGRLNRRLWRAVHLLAYLSWPVALVHGIGAGKDLQRGWLLGLAVGCVLVVIAAVAWRLAAAARPVPPAGRVAAVFAEHTSQSSRRARPGRRPGSR